MRRTERQHLPNAESGLRQEIHKTVCIGTQVAIADATRQRGGMEQHPGTPLFKDGGNHPVESWPGRMVPPCTGAPPPRVNTCARYSGGSTPIS